MGKKIWIIAGISIISILILGIIIYFGLNLQSIVSGPMFNLRTDSVVSENTNSVIFKHSFSRESPVDLSTRGDCNLVAYKTIDFYLLPEQANSLKEIPRVIEGLQENIQFKTSNFKFYEIQVVVNTCSGSPQRAVDFKIEDIDITCGIMRYGKGMALRCEKIYAKVIPIENNVPVYGSIRALNSCEITVEILKQGIECTNTQMSLCEANEICVNNICQLNQLKQIYYKFSDNSCSQIEIFDSEKTIYDYLTLSECEENKLINLVDNTIEEELIIENKSVIDKIFKITPEQKEIVVVVDGKEQTIQTKNNYNRLIIFIGIIVFIIILILILILTKRKR